jgi:Heat induced stress protein YflT
LTPSIQEQSVASMYDSHCSAASAVQALQQTGFDMKRLSIVGRDQHAEEHARGFYTSGDRTRFWGESGSFGTFSGMLSGTVFFDIPSIGPLVAMGPLVRGIVGALEGAPAGGSGGVLAAALTSVGIPKDLTARYERALSTGSFLVVAYCGP